MQGKAACEVKRSQRQLDIISEIISRDVRRTSSSTVISPPRSSSSETSQTHTTTTLRRICRSVSTVLRTETYYAIMTTTMYKVPHFRALSRLLHVSSTSRHLVGPNDPVSNLRPIIYTDTPTPAASHSQGSRQREVNHPYSLNEFTDVPHDHTLELQYKLAREQLDAFNHNYWTEVCRASPFGSVAPVHSQLSPEQHPVRSSQAIRLGVSSRICLARNA